VLDREQGADDDDRVRQLTSTLRPGACWPAPTAYQLELGGPILIRYGRDRGRAALERLATLDSRWLSAGSFLDAELGGEVVAAAPLDGNCEPLSDPLRPTANVRELVSLQARHARRYRDVSDIPLEPMPRHEREAA
jgi:hypothetical protein